jgi:Sec7-like guanine-nucleotide exchange factor
MLNTDLHNPNMENKMSFEQFMKNCKKINNGQDLPEVFLKESYQDIKNNEIKTFKSRDLVFEKNIYKIDYFYQ